MRPRRYPPAFATPRDQQGAALYVAMVLLIVLALIGIVGMQVAGMQEKMSANYRNSNMAFQNAEARARDAECSVEAQINRTVGASSCTAVNIEQVCDTGFDATNWASQKSMGDPLSSSTLARSVGKCMPGKALGMGVKPESEDPNPVFQITAYATDTTVNPSADAAVDTIFRP